jgi:osmoprotectant transport system ATP-binding protein
VPPGSIVVFLGPSGCGKTTLLKMVNRLVEPTAGSILVDGVDVRSQPAEQLRRGIGYVIQQAGLFPHMRVADNVAVVPRLLGWPKAKVAARVDELLDLVGLEPELYGRRYPRQLSGGQQQRVGLARALAAEPTLLLMDEPFGALDAITRTRLQGELVAIHARLTPTILFVTHDIEEAVRLADSVAVMRDGRVVQYGHPLDIVLRPADDFVRELVGAEDVLRRLSLVPAASVARQSSESTTGPATGPGASLRDALSLLLESGAPEVRLEPLDGSPDMAIDLAIIKAASVAGWTPETGNSA